MNWPGANPIATESGFGAETTAPTPELAVTAVEPVYEILPPEGDGGFWSSLDAYMGTAGGDYEDLFLTNGDVSVGPATYAPVATVAAAPKPAVPTWVWIAGAGALAFFIFRR